MTRRVVPWLATDLVLVLSLVVSCHSRKDLVRHTTTDRDSTTLVTKAEDVTIVTDTTKTRYALQVIDRFHHDTITSREYVLLGAQDRYLRAVEQVDMLDLLNRQRTVVRDTIEVHEGSGTPACAQSEKDKLIYNIGKATIGIASIIVVLAVCFALRRLKRRL